jgi:predicted DNA-binding protein with PD1-like motif
MIVAVLTLERKNNLDKKRKEKERMEAYQKKMGRIFRLEFEKGNNLLGELSNFARKENIKEASLFVLGAIGDGHITTGFISLKETEKGRDSNIRNLGEKRECLGLGNLTWPAKKPLAIKDPIPWDEPQPYPHLHLLFGPDVGKDQKELLTGHLHKGIASGVTVLLYELV